MPIHCICMYVSNPLIQGIFLIRYLQRTLEVLLTPDIGALYSLHEIIRAEALTVLQVQPTYLRTIHTYIHTYIHTVDTNTHT